jgi:hypothetical protein
MQEEPVNTFLAELKVGEVHQKAATFNLTVLVHLCSPLFVMEGHIVKNRKRFRQWVAIQVQTICCHLPDTF